MLITLVAVSAVGLILFAFIMKSPKSLKHMYEEAVFEIKYNLVGLFALLDDILMKSKNKTELYTNPNKIVVITGGTRGIGPEVIKMFLICDMNVVMGCRTPDVGKQLLAKIREEGIVTGKLDVHKLDVSSLESVNQFAKVVKEKYPKIDILLNMAGIMYVPFELTPDGYESQFATNYLGHFLLTHLLMNNIKAAGTEEYNARIVNVSSCAHTQGIIDFDDINNSKGYYLSWKAYAQSKLAQILFSNHLNKICLSKKENVQVHSVHPGIVNTDLFEGTLLKTIAPWFINMIFKTPKEGAYPIVNACLSKYLEGRGGTYISNCRIKETSDLAQSQETAEQLFKYTNNLLKIKEFGKA